jgi:hypothetical protein
MIVITAQRGGTLRETISMAKEYTEARRQHGLSELLDDVVASKPQFDHTRYGSPEELKDHGLAHLRDAVALLQSKASPGELDEYRHFIVELSRRVAEAHRNGGSEEAISPEERGATNAIAEAVGAATS